MECQRLIGEEPPAQGAGRGVGDLVDSVNAMSDSEVDRLMNRGRITVRAGRVTMEERRSARLAARHRVSATRRASNRNGSLSSHPATAREDRSVLFPGAASGVLRQVARHCPRADWLRLPRWRGHPRLTRPSEHWVRRSRRRSRSSRSGADAGGTSRGRSPAGWSARLRSGSRPGRGPRACALATG